MVESRSSEQTGEGYLSVDSSNIFADTDPEKFSTFFKGKIGNVLAAANTNAESGNNEYNSLMITGTLRDSFSSAVSEWEIGSPINKQKFQDFLYKTFEQGEMNGASDFRFALLARGLESKNSKGVSLIDEKFLSRLGELQGLNPVLDYLDDRSFSLEKFKSYFRETGNDFSNLGQAMSRWLVREVSRPWSDAHLRAYKSDLTDIDIDDAYVLPLLVDPEAIERILDVSSKRFNVDDGYVRSMVSSFSLNYREMKNFLLELKDTNPEEYQLRLGVFGKMLKNYATIASSSHFQSLSSEFLNKSLIESKILEVLQKLTGITNGDFQTIKNSPAFESNEALESLLEESGGMVLAA